MSDGTKIEWSDATCNVVNGCSVVSPGCTNCYAMKLAGTRLRHHPSREGLTVASKAGPVWNGEVRFNETALLQPLHWRRSRKIFWNAHGDLFHPKVPDEWIDRCFAVMALTPQHIHQVLTKRPERMALYVTGLVSGERSIWESARNLGEKAVAIAKLVSELGWGRFSHSPRKPLPNVWLGTSTEDQTRADERIPHLLATPAAVRFVSAEPLLGPVDLTRVRRFPDAPKEYVNAVAGRFWTDQSGLPNPDPRWAYPGMSFSDGGRGLDWVIVGGESGPGARPMHPDWARSLRDQCAAAGVAFHFKQWGAWLPSTMTGANLGSEFRSVNRNGHLDAYTVGMNRLGKKAAGRMLDGVEHNGMPA